MRLKRRLQRLPLAPMIVAVVAPLAMTDEARAEQVKGAVAEVIEPILSDTPRGTFSFFRWNDDFSSLDAVEDRIGIERFKRLPVFGNPDIRASFGGDYRLRIEGFSSPDYGLTGLDDYTSVQNRFHLHGDIAFADRFRVFGQLGYFIEDGREPRSRSTDFGDLDIHQLFADFALPGGFRNGRVRIGRQELTLGANILFGSREGANVRRVFDAAKLETAVDDFRIQAFVGRPVLSEPDAFDDSAAADELTWGIYTTYAPADRPTRVDLYYLGRSDDAQVFAQGVEKETRHTVGARYYGDLGAFEFDVEGAYQFGSFGTGDISAWAVATDVRYTFETARWTPRVGIRVNAASGDRDAGDPDLQSFNALYPNLAYFSDAATFAPINAFDVQPYVELRASENLRFELAADAIFRLDGDDAFYGPGQRVIVPAGGSDGELATVLLQAKATWDINRYATGVVSIVHGTAGPLIEDAGGEDFTYFQFQLSTRF